MERMTRGQIDKLLKALGSGGPCDRVEMEETHISWVILRGDYVYKIKKPLRLHFLDFSTVEKRKFYCEREVLLNRRLTEGIYLDVLPVKTLPGDIFIGHQPGDVVDYAVHMHRMEAGRRMDVLLRTGEVTHHDIDQLACKIADFHRATTIIREKDLQDIPDKFADLATEEDFLRMQLPADEAGTINRAIRISAAFSKRHGKRVRERIMHGYTRDCHGDLHTKNIFLLEKPQPFDCIEFSDDLRQTDVLNEVAFLCMDLDAFGREDLSRRFFKTYLTYFAAVDTAEDEQLFIYYKSYRANVRAKIDSMRARNAATEVGKMVALAEAGKYLRLMNDYLQQLL